jgi:hypothetical protein
MDGDGDGDWDGLVEESALHAHVSIPHHSAQTCKVPDQALQRRGRPFVGR